MKKLLGCLLMSFSALRLIPHIILFLCSAKKGVIKADIARWTTVCFKGSDGAGGYPFQLIRLMTQYPEYRNLFYYRIGWKGKLFKPLCRPIATLFINTRTIGPGLFIQHGFSTVIAAREIGENCWINQQVTIGFSNDEDCPSIGDNVIVSAGAIVIGNVTVGDNSKIGANAVVVKDVPPDVTVVGVPAYIVKRNGVRVREDL